MPRPKTTYVIVKVTYDHFRFQQNLAASDDEKYIISYAEELAKSYNMPVLYYFANGARQAELDLKAKRGAEEPHIWIQDLQATVQLF